MLAGGRDALRGQLPAGCRIPTPGGIVARTDRATENKEAGHGGRLSAFQTASDLRRWVLRAGCSLLFCGRMPLFAGRMPASLAAGGRFSRSFSRPSPHLPHNAVSPLASLPLIPCRPPPQPPSTTASPPPHRRPNTHQTTFTTAQTTGTTAFKITPRR